MTTLRRLLRNFFTGLLAVLLLFEEWGWEPLAALLARLARLPLLAWIERKIQALPPWAAVLALALPALGLLPVKLLALYLIGNSHSVLGLGVLLAAKLLGTALVAHLFALTQPALMKLPWFARWYPRWRNWKNGLIAQLRESTIWRLVRRLKLRARARWVLLRRFMQ
ncbi:MAG: hypothetical protein ABIT82_07590 [Ramlibacter sp.]